MSGSLKQKIEQKFKEILSKNMTIKTIPRMGDNVLDVSEIRDSIMTLQKDVLGLLDEATTQIQQIMNEDYWTANFHLNNIREKILAVLVGEAEDKK